MSRKSIMTLAAAGMFGLMTAASAPAQTKPADNPPQRNGGGGGGPRFDPAQFRQRMLERVQEQIGATDEEMKTLTPKLDKVFQLQRDLMGGGRRGGPGGNAPGGGPGGADANQPQSAVMQKRQALQQALDDRNAKPEEIKAKLDEYRAAKTQARQDLAKAQEDLAAGLSDRQQAALVAAGLLD